MPAIANHRLAPETTAIDPEQLRPNPFSVSLYGDPSAEIDDLIASIREHGILVAPRRRARAGAGDLGSHLRAPPAGLCAGPGDGRGPLPGASPAARRRAAAAVLEYNRQRRKTFSQLMREADALEELWGSEAGRPSAGQPAEGHADRRIPPTAPIVGIPTLGPVARIPAGCRRSTAGPTGRPIEAGPMRRSPGTSGWAARTSTGRRGPSGGWPSRATPGPQRRPAARRRDQDHPRRLQGLPPSRPLQRRLPTHAVRRLAVPPRPGLRHPPSRLHPAGPGGACAPLLHGPRRPGRRPHGRRRDHARRLPVDGTPMPGVRPPSRPARRSAPTTSGMGFPPEAVGCDLIFCDPPYHTMLARQYARDSIATAPLSGLDRLPPRPGPTRLRTPSAPAATSRSCSPPRPRRTSPPASAISITPFLAIPRRRRAGFLPERRISCPMDGAYLPQHVRRARAEGRLLGQVRDLLVMRKPSRRQDDEPALRAPYAEGFPFDLV